MSRVFVSVLAALFVTVFSGPQLGAREWRLDDGSAVRGNLLRFRNTYAVIQTVEGRRVFAFDRFSPGDRAWLLDRFPAGNRRLAGVIVGASRSEGGVPVKELQAAHPGLSGLESGDTVPFTRFFSRYSREDFAVEDFPESLVLVCFWEDGNQACVNELLRVKALQASFPELRLEVFNVCRTDNIPASAATLIDLGVAWPTAFDTDGSVARRWGVGQLPTNVLVSGNGEIVEEHTYADFAALQLDSARTRIAARRR